MIISNSKKKTHPKRKITTTTLFLIVALLVIIVSTTVVYKILSHKNNALSNAISCSAENVITNKNGKKFQHNYIIFGNGDTQSSEESNTGRFSSKVYKNSPYGFTYTIENINEGEIYTSEVWRLSNYHYGKLAAQGSWGFYRETKTVIEKNKNNWELLQLKIIIPRGIKKGDIKYFVYNTNNEPAYFDDFKIMKLPDIYEFSKNNYTSLNIQTLTIKIDDKGLKKLKAKRDEAFKKGILVTNNDDFVEIKLIDNNNNEIPAFTRLKGDWLDHLKENKWSFRIKPKKNYAWNRMKEFSVHNPLTRHFIDEWVFHKLLEYEDILTPAYGFIVLHLNSKDLGIYAYEEHFTKQLLQKQGRKESVIIKFDEDGLWDARVKDYKNNFSIATFEGSEIKPFSIKNVIKSEKLLNEFKKAHNLMFQYKYGMKATSEIFDIDKLARYYAILDITKAFHGIIWHNQRMYFNPITEKLEPIGFDGYAEGGVFDWIHRPFIGYSRNDFSGWKPGDMIENIFHDNLFVEKYIYYLRQFTEEIYLDNFFSEVDGQIKKIELYLQTEYPNYKYDKNFLYSNASSIRNHLIPYERIALKIYLQNSSRGKMTLRIGSTHSLPIELVGVGNKNIINSYINEKIILPSYNINNPIEFYDIGIKGSGNTVHYKVLGLDSIYTININKWPAPFSYSAEQELYNTIKEKNLTSNAFYTVRDSLIIFSGNYTIDNDIIIPKNYTVKFLSNSKINFTNNSKFISKSPVYMYGNEDEPIIITSSDGTFKGFTVLQADKKSYLRYVTFDNLNALDYKGWKLTGAITFFESEVEFSKCNFTNINSEDALNIIRSEFTISNSFFSNCSADAFDADFCKGKILNSIFINSGKDALEFSGSIVTVSKCIVKKARANAINLNMEAKVTVDDFTVENSKTAASASDLSELTFNNIILKNCKVGFIAYQKLPEYGGGTIIVNKYKSEDIEKLYAIEEGSILKINNSVVSGNK